MKRLYKFSTEQYYGQIDGIFLADSEEMELFFKDHTHTIYLGEALGKHSEVELELTLSDFIELPLGSLTTSEMGLFCLGYDALALLKESIEDEISYAAKTGLLEILENLGCSYLFDYYSKESV